jgi:hypothetical protein
MRRMRKERQVFFNVATARIQASWALTVADNDRD